MVSKTYILKKKWNSFLSDLAVKIRQWSGYVLTFESMRLIEINPNEEAKEIC